MASKFELKKAPGDKFVFQLISATGQVVLSSEPHASHASALSGIASVRKHGASGQRFGRLSAKDGSPYFTLKAGNGQVIGHSPQYAGAKARDAGIEAVQSCVADAPLDDQTGAA